MLMASCFFEKWEGGGAFFFFSFKMAAPYIFPVIRAIFQDGGRQFFFSFLKSEIHFSSAFHVFFLSKNKNKKKKKK